MASRYTMGFLPKTDVRIPFTVIWADSDDDAKSAAEAIQALRVAGSRWSLTKHVSDNSGNAVAAPGAGFKVCFEFKVPATGGIIKVCIEHVKQNADFKSISDALAANAKDPAGHALGDLIRMTLTPQTYV